MAMICVTGGSECDGCCRCHIEPRTVAVCDVCHEPIYVGDDHYSIEDETIHEDCLHDWAKQYFVRGDT